MRANLRIGEAVHIRLMPREIMTCIAITQKVASDVQNISLAQAVRIAVTELCEAAIAVGLVKAPEEYDYDQVTSTFRRGSMARKVQTAQAIVQAQMDRVTAGKSAAFGGLRLNIPDNDKPVIVTPEQRAANIKRFDELAAAERGEQVRQAKRTDPRLHRLRELRFKSEQDPANTSPSEFKELRKLERALGASAA